MFYLINKNTRELLRASATPFNADATVQPPLPVFQLRRVINDTQPAFNAATHKLIRTSVDDDNAATRTFRYEAIPLTQAELDAKAQAAADEAERQVLRAAYLDLKNGTGTQAERLRRVERAAAWLLRQYVQQ